MSGNELKKGELAEERLRLYFLNLGYFVVRSIKAQYQGFDVTDVDLFLYSRSSPISRERTNVDVKMKQKPQSLERIFWAKGLKEVLGLEKCIVATTDKRNHIGEFGAQNDVLVLDGSFMQKLGSTERYSMDRLNEEEFLDLLSGGSSNSSRSDWRKQHEEAKSNLLIKLNFDGLNEFLNRTKYFLEQLCSGYADEACYRALYSSIAFFLVALDYVVRDVSYKNQQDRAVIISDGIRFGEKGKQKSEEIVAMASALTASFMKRGESDTEAIKSEVYSQFMGIPADDLANYLCSTEMMKRLFPMAVEFEGYAYKRVLSAPLSMSSELQSIFGLLCDFFSLDRKKVLV